MTAAMERLGAPSPRPRSGGAPVVAILCGCLVLFSAAGVLAGVGGMPDRGLLLTSRLPRVLAAILTGAGLAVAGLIMQSLARNRFVEPMMAGTGQAAGLGILLATIAAPGASIMLKSLAGALAAFAGTAAFLFLARRLPPSEPFLVPLLGIVYGGVLAAVATAIAWNADLMQFLETWFSGEMSGILAGRYELLWANAALLAAAVFIADRLTILSLGRDAAEGLGVGFAAMLAAGLGLVCVIAAVTVVTVGIIPFVGLVVPAMASRLIGDNVRTVMPVVALGGAVLVLASDTLGRFIRFPYEVPVGTVLGVVGAFVFLATILTRRG